HSPFRGSNHHSSAFSDPRRPTPDHLPPHHPHRLLRLGTSSAARRAAATLPRMKAARAGLEMWGEGGRRRCSVTTDLGTSAVPVLIGSPPPDLSAASAAASS